MSLTLIWWRERHGFSPVWIRNLDFLFVDEAGQVSLANLVAMGLSAKNIVLLGDQMQLGQPIQGVHPGRSGESTLEFLLDGEATIKPDRGVFLDVTWRMRHDVCQFISEAVYDSRLKPEKRNQNQRLLLNSDAHECLKPSGVSFVPIEHDGCSQKSQEEADLIKEMVASLVRQSYRDRNGNEQPITLENIMVVAPYNMQVNLLKRGIAERGQSRHRGQVSGTGIRGCHSLDDHFERRIPATPHRIPL